jgi:hypothetical protein
MNRPAVLSLAAAVIALAPIVAPAQILATDSTRMTTVYRIPNSTGCPVGLRAQRQVTPGTVIVKNGREDQRARENKFTQRLRMTLTNPNWREVVGIQITAHGFSAKARVVPTVSAQSDASELKKTIDLKLNVGYNQHAITDLMLDAFTSVSRIDLDSVDYADGSSWHSSAGQTCHIAPDGIMLVSSR